MARVCQVRRIAERIKPCPEFSICGGKLHCTTVCTGAKPVHEELEAVSQAGTFRALFHTFVQYSALLLGEVLWRHLTPVFDWRAGTFVRASRSSRSPT